jgi:PAS domain-containing protein
MNASSTAHQVKGILATNVLGKHDYHEDTGLNLPELTIYDNGMIRSCSKAAVELLGYSFDKLRWRHISIFLPQLSEVAITKGGQINPNLRFLSHIGHHFDVINIQGAHIACALFFNEIERSGKHYLRVIFRPVEPQYSVL